MIFMIFFLLVVVSHDYDEFDARYGEPKLKELLLWVAAQVSGIIIKLNWSRFYLHWFSTDQE